MRARMNAKGVILLTPETNVEAYALTKWYDAMESCADRNKDITDFPITHTIPQED